MSHLVGMDRELMRETARGRQGQVIKRWRYRWTCTCGDRGEWQKGNEGRHARTLVQRAGMAHQAEAVRAARGEAREEVG